MIGLLKNSSLFKEMDDNELNIIANYSTTKNIRKDEVLYEFSERGDDFYVVMSGRIASSITLQSGQERIIEEYLSGDFFGETSLFEKLPRSTTCRAVEDSLLLCIDENRFLGLIEEYSEIAIKVMLQMLALTTQRLRNTSKFLADIVQWGERERKRTIRDELTGLYNLRYFNDALARCFSNSVNSSKPISLIMADLDYFREINEALKEEGADNILKELASIFKKYLRKNDVAARYGGDEFVILLPETGQEEAKSIAEKIRSGVSAMNLSDDGNEDGIKITLSQGIASFPENAGNPDGLKKKADSALYRAKEQGKNRIECA